MPLVTRIIGDCPECGAKNAFGNVSVGADVVVRGCLFCKYGYHWPLPPVRKKVLYPDQFCFSRAFRRKDPAQDQKYVAAFARLEELALRQVLVVPYSSVHEDETYQWKGDDAQTHKELMDFIKRSSGGHEVERASSVQREQLSSAFVRYLKGGSAEPEIDPSDAVPSDLHSWTDYYWIDVPGYWNDTTRIRQAKEGAIADLVRVLPQWRDSQNDFAADLAVEYRGAASAYLNGFRDYVMKMAPGDVMAHLNAPVSSLIVESLMQCFDRDVPGQDRMRSVIAFFASEHFKNVPYQWLSTRIIAVLKHRIRRDPPVNLRKAAERISNTFDDMEHVATYAPYCDAVFVDGGMAEILRDPRVGLTQKFGTKVFSEGNWGEFKVWMDSLDANLSAEHLEGLSFAYPDSIANPIVVMRSHVSAGGSGGRRGA